MNALKTCICSDQEVLVCLARVGRPMESNPKSMQCQIWLQNWIIEKSSYFFKVQFGWRVCKHDVKKFY